MPSRLSVKELNKVSVPGLSLARGGGTGAALPQQASLVGAWYADQINTSVRAIPNSVIGTTPKNVLRAPRRLFNNTSFWGKVNTTVTDEGFTAPDGSSDASRVVGAGGASWNIKAANAAFAAGTYTIGVNVKSNTGASQGFRLSPDNGATNSSVLTATTSWQRFSYTFTGTPTAFLLRDSDGTTAGDLVICDYEVFSGSSDLGPNGADGHIYLGNGVSSTQPSYASGLLDCTNGYGSMQLATAISSSTGFTCIALASKNSSNNYDSFLSKIQSYTNMSAFVAQNGAPTDFRAANYDASGRTELWSLLNKPLHVYTQRWDGTNRDLFMDDVRVFRKASSVSTFTMRDFFIGVVNSSATLGGLKIHAILLYSTNLTDAEVAQAVSYLQTRAAAVAVSASSVSRIYVAEGDSITLDGYAPPGYPYTFATNASPVVYGANYAVGNATLNNNSGNSVVERAALIDGILPPAASRSGRKFILSCLIGANGLAAYATGAAGWAADYAAYCDARRAAGWLVVVCTILPISGNATHNSRRATINSQITSSWLGVHCDAIADFAADSIMGTDTSYTDSPTYWADILHPSLLGQDRLETILRPVINAL